jgi:hypothetical protein
MKRTALSLGLLFILTTLYGQYSFDLGLKAGLNNSKVTVNKEEFNATTINKFHVGAFARFNLDWFYLQPEAYYSSKGGDIEEIVGGSALDAVSSFDYHMVDVPLILGIKVINKKALNFRVLTGPVFSFLTDTSIESQNSELSTEYFKDRLFGWQYGLGVDFLMFTLDARIERSSGNIYTSNYLDSKNQTFLVSLGIKIM